MWKMYCSSPPASFIDHKFKIILKKGQHAEKGEMVTLYKNNSQE